MPNSLSKCSSEMILYSYCSSTILSEMCQQLHHQLPQRVGMDFVMCE